MQRDVTVLLRRVHAGDKEAESHLFTAVYGELRQLAGSQLRRERQDHTIQPTALVNEAYLKLTGASPIDWRNRTHFFRVASRIMRQVLVDYARGRVAQKRGGKLEVLPLDETLAMDKNGPSDFVALNDALEQFKQLDPRAYQVIEMRFFGGLSVEETAEGMGISIRTVKRDWRAGRAWLLAELESKVSGNAASMGSR